MSGKQTIQEAIRLLDISGSNTKKQARDILNDYLTQLKTSVNKNDKHNQNIDKVNKLYNDMMDMAMAQRQKNKWAKVFEPELERWFKHYILKLVEKESERDV